MSASRGDVSDLEMLAIGEELWGMVQDGLLEVSVGPDGDPVFWPTVRGRRVLGMAA